MSLQPGIYYVQRGPLGFLSDSEWDGDSFSKSPHDADKRTEPWFNGGRLGGNPYVCTKVKLWFDVNKDHDKPTMKSFQSHKSNTPKTRFRVECPRCGWSTKSYAIQMTAIETWNHQNKEHPCQIARWEILE